MRHDALTIGGDFRVLRPAGNVHLRSAPRSGLDKAFDTLIVPGQEHLLSMARRQAPACGEKPGLMPVLSQGGPEPAPGLLAFVCANGCPGKRPEWSRRRR